MKATEKQILAISNLNEFMGTKPKTVKTVQEADLEIKRLIPLVKEYEIEMNDLVNSGPAGYDFCF